MPSVKKIEGRWRALIRLKGRKPISKRFATKAEADDWAYKTEAQLREGRATEDGQKLTVAQLIQRYRDLRDKGRPIADTSNEHYQLKSLARILGDLPAAAVSHDDLLGWAQRRKDEGAGPYTVNMDLSKLGTVYRFAGGTLNLQDPTIAVRPMLTHLRLIGGGGKRERRPTEEELRLVIEYLADKRGERYADAVAFAAVTAMRRGEVTSIRWADVDEKKRLVGCWRKHPRKTKTWELVPLLGDAWGIMQRQPRDDERIFPIHQQTVSKYFKWACDELGIPDLHFHDLRHDGVSSLFEQGYTIEQVALVSGHKDWRHLQRYTNLKPESLHGGPRKKG